MKPLIAIPLVLLTLAFAPFLSTSTFASEATVQLRYHRQGRQLIQNLSDPRISTDAKHALIQMAIRSAREEIHIHEKALSSYESITLHSALRAAEVSGDRLTPESAVKILRYVLKTMPVMAPSLVSQE